MRLLFGDTLNVDSVSNLYLNGLEELFLEESSSEFTTP